MKLSTNSRPWDIMYLQEAPVQIFGGELHSSVWQLQGA